MRRRIYTAIDSVSNVDPISQAYDLFIVVFSVLSIVPLGVTEASTQPHVYAILKTIETLAVYILFFDYVLCWATHDYRSKHSGIVAFILYPFTPKAIITLVGLLPTLTLLPRLFALLRLANLGRLLRYSKSLRLVVNSIKAEQGPLISTIILLIGYILCSAIIVFVAEPETFSNFFEALYWSTLANTSVGYADFLTISPIGRLVSMGSALMSIAVIALPSGIVTTGFMNQMREIDRVGEDVYFEEVITINRMRQLVMRARESVTIGMAESGNTRLFPFLRWHINNNPRLAVYSGTMLLCLGLNLALYLLKPIIGLPLWLDMTGTALAAMLLNPMAGLLVGFCSNLTMAILSGGDSSLLFFAENAMTAIVFGVFFARDKKINVRSFLALFVFAIVGEAAFSLWMDIIFLDNLESSVLNSTLASALMARGVPIPLCWPFAEVLEKGAEVILTFVIANTLLQFIQNSKFDPVAFSQNIAPSERVEFIELLEEINSAQGPFNPWEFAEMIGYSASPDEYEDEEDGEIDDE